MAGKAILPVSNVPIKVRQIINPTLSLQKTTILHITHMDISEDNQIL
jgi:hypothetical protein